MSKRERILRGFDSLALRIATRKYGFFGPIIAYQDLPWVGIKGARRALGSNARLSAMLDYLGQRHVHPRSVLDIGCNIGFFSMSFAEQGAVAYGVEMDPLPLRVAVIASRHINSTTGRFVPLQMTCTPETVLDLPPADVTVCLSIWHHWVRHQGLEAATQILKAAWARTRSTLFFDTGENEMPAYFNLPFKDQEAAPWIQEYLQKITASPVEILGRFPAFPPGGHEARVNVQRTLFAITRADNGGEA